MLNDEINADDIVHLIIYNKKKWPLSLDLYVYSKNQHFRLYNSLKSDLNNSLITTVDYLFE